MVADSAAEGDSALSNRRKRRAASIRIALNDRIPTLPRRGTWKPRSAHTSLDASGEMTVTAASNSQVRFRSSTLAARRRWMTSTVTVMAERGSRPASQHQLHVRDSAICRSDGRQQAPGGGRRDQPEVEVDRPQRPAQLARASQEPEHEMKRDRGRQRRQDHVEQVPLDQTRAMVGELREVPPRQVDAEQEERRGQRGPRRAQRHEQDDRQLAHAGDQGDPALGVHDPPRIHATPRLAGKPRAGVSPRTVPLGVSNRLHRSGRGVRNRHPPRCDRAGGADRYRRDHPASKTLIDVCFV